MNVSPAVWFALAGGLIPAAVFLVVSWMDRNNRNRKEKAPQEANLLRPPGYSLSLRIDDYIDRALLSLMLGCILCAGAGGMCYTLLKFLEISAPVQYPLTSGTAMIAFAGAGIFFWIRGMHQLDHARNYRLGLRGEQAVAEVLHEVGECGYRVFHDLPGGDNWNIDHIVIGPQGVFAIETKARRRRGSRGDQPAHEVRYDEKVLRFPTGDDTNAIPQAQRNARWLANYLAKKTGEPVIVKPIVVVPGWYVSALTPTNLNANVMNATYLGGYLRRQPETLGRAQLRRIITAIDEKCRDMEF